jgi:hypothetical protein
MPNTKVQRTLHGSASSRKVVRLIHIVSDGSEETDLVVYDNSTLIADVTRGRVMRVQATGSSCTCRLEWDQTTDSPVCSFDPISGVDLDFCCFGGVSNPNETGATGDLTLTTAGLDSGDELVIIIEINQE